MGQQQLLLTILVTIVIGIAVVVATNTMQSAFAESKKDALRQDILMVMNDARVYYNKPEMLDGGGNSFEGITEKDVLSIEPENENGTYEISNSENSITVEGTGVNGDVTISATATMSADGMDISWSEAED